MEYYMKLNNSVIAEADVSYVCIKYNRDGQGVKTQSSCPDFYSKRPVSIKNRRRKLVFNDIFMHPMTTYYLTHIY